MGRGAATRRRSLPGGGRRLRLELPDGARATVLAPYLAGPRLWIADLHLRLPVHAYLAAHGRPIRYSYVREEHPLAAYQTVFATEPGSAEMPSAGRLSPPSS